MSVYQYSDLSSVSASKLDRDYKAIENSIRNILLTPVGSLPGKPLFGSKIHKFLFDIIDNATQMFMEEEIQVAITNWEPRAILKNVIVEQIPEYNRLIIKVYFTIKKDPSKQIYDLAIKVK